jgi:hypothetical protein
MREEGARLGSEKVRGISVSTSASALVHIAYDGAHEYVVRNGVQALQMTSWIYEGLERIPLSETDLKVGSMRKSVRKWLVRESLRQRATTAIVMVAAARRGQQVKVFSPRRKKGF